MKAPALLTAAVVVGALLLSELCRPRTPDLVLMFLKDENFAEATRLARQLSDSGDTSAAAISVRSTFLVEAGDVERAIGLLEHFLRDHPDDRAGHELLARLYGDAQRPGDRLRELRALTRQTPNSERLRELTLGFAAEGAWESRREALTELIRQPDAQADDFIALARLDAALGRLPEALQVLDSLRKRYPDSYDDDLARFHEEIEADVPASGSNTSRTVAWTARRVRVGRVRHCDADAHATRAPPHARAGGALLEALDTAADDETRTAIIDRLDRAGAAGTALTALEHLSDRDPGTWLGSYVEHAKSAGAQARMRKFLAARAADKVLAGSRRQEFAYALLDQGMSADLLQALASLASDFAGEWEDAYTDALAKLNRNSELRAHLLAAGSKADAPPEARRAVAWRLLELGAKEEGEQVFRQLAAAEPADGPDVEVLLSLWGPRPAAPQLAWLQARANAAPAKDAGAWMRRLTAAGAPDRAIAVFESASPQTGDMRIARLGALAARDDGGVLRAALVAELERSSGISDPAERAATLRQLGDLARDADLASESERAYAQLTALDSKNSTACRSHALAALAAGHAKRADEELSRCRTLVPPDFESAVAAGDAALALGDHHKARVWYGRALRLTSAGQDEDSSQDLGRAHALEHVGRIADADRVYRRMAARNRADLSLRADWAEMLLNAGLAREAYAVATGSAAGDNTAPHAAIVEVVEGDHALELRVKQDCPAPASSQAQGKELIVRVGCPLSDADAAAITALTKDPRSGGRIEDSQTGYDSFLLRAAAGSWQRSDSEHDLRARLVIADSGKLDPARVRLGLLAARAEMQLGDIDSALERLQTLHSSVPHDTEVLSLLASYERQLERWRAAREHYSEAARELGGAGARAADDIREQLADIDRDQGARSALDVFHQSSANGPAMLFQRFSFGQRPDSGWLLQGTFEEVRLDAKGVQHPGGELLDFSGDRARGEASLQYDSWSGDAWRASAFAGYGDALGLGVMHAHAVRRGSMLFNLEYHRPNWDFTEGLVSGATRDRLAVGRSALWGRTSLKLEIGLASYRLAGEESAKSTALSAMFRLPLTDENGRLWLVYNLDAEYFRDIRQATDSLSRRYEPLPAADRELHYLQLETSRELARHSGGGRGAVEFSAGGVANRFGRVEPTVTSSLSWTSRHIQMRLYATHEPSTAAQYDVVTVVGASVAMTSL